MATDKKLNKVEAKDQASSTFSEALQIDRFDLFREWERQPTLYHKYAVLHADAVLARDVAKDNLDLVSAQLDRQTREAMTAAGTKTTETAIRNTILETQEYGEVRDAVAQAEHQCNVLMAGVRALDHKKTALEFMSRMQLADWNSEPNVPGEARKLGEKGEQARQEERLASNPRIGKKKE